MPKGMKMGSGYMAKSSVMKGYKKGMMHGMGNMSASMRAVDGGSKMMMNRDGMKYKMK